MNIEKEYQQLYGNIPESYEERLEYLLNTLTIKNKSVYDKIKSIINIKWKSTSFVIYLLPKATPRPRRSFNGIFYVKGAKDNKDLFRKYIIDINPEIIYTPIKFSCISYFPIPKSMNSVEKVCAELGFIRPISKPDWDNIGKTYCDMIQDLLIYDDSLIIEGTSKKYYSVKPRIEITLSWMKDFDSDFNKKKMLRKVVKNDGK
jgi:Holliday junction resolvase RusA-like endonuclease